MSFFSSPTTFAEFNFYLNRSFELTQGGVDLKEFKFELITHHYQTCEKNCVIPTQIFLLLKQIFLKVQPLRFDPGKRLKAGGRGEVFGLGKDYILKKCLRPSPPKTIPYTFLMEALIQVYLSFVCEKRGKHFFPKILGIRFPADRKGEMKMERFSIDFYTQLKKNSSLDFLCKALLEIIDKIETLQNLFNGFFIHGDLQGNNLMWRKDTGYVFIDLGYSCFKDHLFSLSMHGSNQKGRSFGSVYQPLQIISKCQNITHDLRLLCAFLAYNRQLHPLQKHPLIQDLRKYFEESYREIRLEFDFTNPQAKTKWYLYYNEVIEIIDPNFAPDALRKVFLARKWLPTQPLVDLRS